MGVEQIKSVLFVVSVVVFELICGALITMAILCIIPDNYDLVKLLSKSALLVVPILLFLLRPEPLIWSFRIKNGTILILSMFIIFSLLKWCVFDWLALPEPIENIYTILSAVVVAPLSEELLFRGWMIPYLQSKGFNTTVTLCITSVLFYLWHGQLLAFHRILIGLLLGYTLILEKNITIPIIAHSLANLTVLFIYSAEFKLLMHLL